MTRRAWLLASLRAREAQEEAGEAVKRSRATSGPKPYTVLVCPFLEGTPEADAFRAEHQGPGTIIVNVRM